MSDEAAKKFEEEIRVGTESAQGRSVTLSITLHPNGQIECSLPSNKVLAHGLLGVAGEQLAKISLMADMEKSANLANGGGMAGLLKKMGRR